jgi:hypothetical protein
VKTQQRTLTAGSASGSSSLSFRESKRVAKGYVVVDRHWSIGFSMSLRTCFLGDGMLLELVEPSSWLLRAAVVKEALILDKRSFCRNDV